MAVRVPDLGEERAGPDGRAGVPNFDYARRRPRGPRAGLPVRGLGAGL